MLATLGFLAILLGIILIVVGYTLTPTAIRPGWAAFIIGVVLIMVAYLLPAYS